MSPDLLPPRACGALVRDGRILMVHHVEGERTYWTLPGGGIEPGETPEQAAVREVFEETGIAVRALRAIPGDPAYGGRPETIVLVEDLDPVAVATLGHDPEEAHLPEDQRMLADVGWHNLTDMANDGHVRYVIAALARPISAL